MHHKKHACRLIQGAENWSAQLFLNINICDVKSRQWCEQGWMKRYFSIDSVGFLQTCRQSWRYSERLFTALWKNRIFSIVEQWQWCEHGWMKRYFSINYVRFLQTCRQSWRYSERFFTALWKNRIFSIVEEGQQSIFLSSPRKIVADNIVVIWNEIKKFH